MIPKIPSIKLFADTPGEFDIFWFSRDKECYSLEETGEHNKVEPQFNQVHKDWGYWFIMSGIGYMENLDLMNFLKNHQNVSYIKVGFTICVAVCVCLW